MKKIIFSLLLVIGFINIVGAQIQYKYSIPSLPWEEYLGNHRAIIDVPVSCDAAYLDFVWRRHDKDVDRHQFIIVDSANNQIVANIYRKNVDNEHCEIFFGPLNSGKYYFYYLPYKVDSNPGWGTFKNDYLQQETAPDSIWLNSNNIASSKSSETVYAVISEVQARTEFESFFPMEVIATQKEKNTLLKSNKQNFILFPEDRKFPIRMLDNIPQKWILAPQENKFSGRASRNEYYVFQVGLWAANTSVSNIKVNFTPLVGDRFTLPVSAMTCFNTGGIDPAGKVFSKTLNVSAGKVQPLWIGLDLPGDIPPGKYKGKLTITANNDQQVIMCEINVDNEFLSDRGDSETWRHSRLRWLNSTAGIDEESLKPYSPIKMLSNDFLDLTGKEVTFGRGGLPSSIKVYGEEVLSAPISLSILDKKGAVNFKTQEASIIKQTSGLFSKQVSQQTDLLKLTTDAEVEFDGWMKYTFIIEAKNDVDISDIQLNIPYREVTSTYIIGMGLPGTETPKYRESRWGGPYDSFWSIPAINPKGLRFDNGNDLNYGPFDSFWLGSVKAGLNCELRGASYTGPMLNWYNTQPPPSWFNNGKGGFRIKTEGGTCNAMAYVGGMKLSKGEKVTLECAFLITPVKHLNTSKQFIERYYHNTSNPNPSEKDLSTGIKIINVHHGNEYNPYINYPFLSTEKLKAFVDKYHNKGLKIKIYYTIRMLSNHATEIWAFRSLGSEFFTGGAGGGHPWLREHFVEDYDVQWYQRNDSTDVCNGIQTTSDVSRLYNYYIEGVSWLVDNTGIDGLYLDDVAFGRDMLKRIRKVVSKSRPDFLIDLHSHRGATGAPALQYAEFYPYIDKIWFGEDFLYNEMPPVNWLTEASGIPFGLMGDMLEGGGNPWRGMIYGMSSRLPWMGDPTEMWKIWDSFGIADSKMVGYWDNQPFVTTSDKDVLATAYIKDKKVLVSIASWASQSLNVKLAIDFKRIGLDPDHVTIIAPEIKDVQPYKKFVIGESIPIDPKKGWILILE